MKNDKLFNQTLFGTIRVWVSSQLTKRREAALHAVDVRKTGASSATPLRAESVPVTVGSHQLRQGASWPI